MPWICEHGHLAATRDLVAAGATRRSLERGISTGRLVRVVRGTLACAHLDDDALRAARSGGLIDCVSALARHDKVWSGLDDAQQLHVRVPPHGHLTGNRVGLRPHWESLRTRPVHPLEVAPADAVLQAMECLDPVDALASVESAHHEGYLDSPGLALVLRQAPRRMAVALRRIDLASGSGFETHVRWKILEAGYRVRSQAHIPGAGEVDLLVEDCVAVEADGEKWHGPERFLPDRTKDLGVERWGIRSMRIGRPHIFEHWAETLAVLDGMIREARRSRPWRWSS